MVRSCATGGRADGRTRISAAELQRITDMRERGCSYQQIARTVGWSAGTIAWRCYRLGIEKPKPSALRPDHYARHPVIVRNGRAVRAFGPDEDAQIQAMSVAGMSAYHIGHAIGRKHNSVLARLISLARRAEREETLHG